MKGLVLGTLGVLTVTPFVYLSYEDQKRYDRAVHEICMSAAQAAESSVKVRYNGLPKKELIEILRNDIETDDQDFFYIVEHITDQVYEGSISMLSKEDAIKKYRNKVTDDCYENDGYYNLRNNDEVI